MTGRVALELGRVSNLPTVWTNVLAGAALGGRIPEARALGATLVALSLMYTGGMWLNDGFDREIDARTRPERPIPSGKVTAKQVFAGGFAMLAAGLLLLATVGARPLASGLALAVLIVVYDVWHKQNSLSPLVMGLCRACVYLTAAAAAGPLSAKVSLGAAVMVSYLIGLTYVARQENRSRFGKLWPLGFLSVAVLHPSPLDGAGVAFSAVALLAWLVYALSFLSRARGPRIPKAVVSLIAGISLVDARFVEHAGRTDLALCAALGFALTLYFQKHIRGT